MWVGGPKRVPLRTCEMRVSVYLDARVEHEDEVGGDEAGEAGEVVWTAAMTHCSQTPDTWEWSLR